MRARVGRLLWGFDIALKVSDEFGSGSSSAVRAIGELSMDGEMFARPAAAHADVDAFVDQGAGGSDFDGLSAEAQGHQENEES